jgi:hypothetical protein
MLLVVTKIPKLAFASLVPGINNGVYCGSRVFVGDDVHVADALRCVKRLNDADHA